MRAQTACPLRASHGILRILCKQFMLLACGRHPRLVWNSGRVLIKKEVAKSQKKEGRIVVIISFFCHSLRRAAAPRWPACARAGARGRRSHRTHSRCTCCRRSANGCSATRKKKKKEQTVLNERVRSHSRLFLQAA
jgi:hypothetical protein